MKQNFDKVPLSIPLLPAHLVNLGFKPHMVGKWHLGHYKDAFTPTRQVPVMFVDNCGGNQCFKLIQSFPGEALPATLATGQGKRTTMTTQTKTA